MNANNILLAILLGGVFFLIIEVLLIALAVMLGNIWAVNHVRDADARAVRRQELLTAKNEPLPQPSSPARQPRGQGPFIPSGKPAANTGTVGIQPAVDAPPPQWK